MKKFNMHFNRVNMQRKKSTVWTIHVSGKCVQVDSVKCYVPLETIFKPNGRQPRARLYGEGDVYVKGKKAFIVDDIVVNIMSDDDYFEATEGKRQ